MVRHRLKLPRLVVVSVIGLLTLTVCAAPPTRGTLGASQVQPTITSVIGSGPTATVVPPIAFKETTVQRIRLLQTAPIYGGPSRQYLTIGAAAKDAELQVTGTSVDGLWWRISCDGRGQLRNQLDCWVEADPTLTAVVTEDKGAVVAATEATATAEVVIATTSTDTPAPAATETAQVVASTDTPAPVVAVSATPAATVAETSTAQVVAVAATDTVVAPTAEATIAATEVATIEPTTTPTAASTATTEASPVPATATEVAATATVEAATAEPTAAPTAEPTAAPTKVPTPLPSPTIAAPTATPATQAAAIKRTTVQYIITQAEVKVLDAPETGAELGTYPAGTKIEVTGYTSADGMWWRVTCLDGTAGACFVSADPSLTAPAVAPK